MQEISEDGTKMNFPFDVTFHPQWWNTHAQVSFSEDFFNDPHIRMDADLRMRRTLHECFGSWGFGQKKPERRPLIDTDLVAGEYLQALMLGCDVKYYDNSYPETIPACITDEEIEALECPDLDSSEAWIRIEDQMKLLKKEFGFVESYLDLHGIQNLALDLRGQQLFVDYYENEESVYKLLSVCTDLIIKVGKRIQSYSDTLSVGVTSIVRMVQPQMFIVSNCTVDMISPDMYETYLLPCDQAICRSFPLFGVHHCGKHTEMFAESYRNVGKLYFVEVGAGSDCKKVRKIFPETHLNLRYSPVRLMEVSRSELKKDIKAMLCDGGWPEKPVSVSCVGIDDGTDFKNIESFMSVLTDMGGVSPLQRCRKES
jgi:uroporphyrinogen-III decarboxylase